MKKSNQNLNYVLATGITAVTLALPGNVNGASLTRNPQDSVQQNSCDQGDCGDNRQNNTKISRANKSSEDVCLEDGNVWIIDHKKCMEESRLECVPEGEISDYGYQKNDTVGPTYGGGCDNDSDDFYFLKSRKDVNKGTAGIEDTVNNLTAAPSDMGEKKTAKLPDLSDISRGSSPKCSRGDYTTCDTKEKCEGLNGNDTPDSFEWRSRIDFDKVTGGYVCGRTLEGARDSYVRPSVPEEKTLGCNDDVSLCASEHACQWRIGGGDWNDEDDQCYPKPSKPEAATSQPASASPATVHVPATQPSNQAEETAATQPATKESGDKTTQTPVTEAEPAQIAAARKAGETYATGSVGTNFPGVVVSVGVGGKYDLAHAWDSLIPAEEGWRLAHPNLRYTFGVEGGAIISTNPNTRRSSETISEESTLLEDGTAYENVKETVKTTVSDKPVAGYLGVKGGVEYQLSKWVSLGGSLGIDLIVGAEETISKYNQNFAVERNGEILDSREDITSQKSALDPYVAARPNVGLEGCFGHDFGPVEVKGCAEGKAGYNTHTKKPDVGGGLSGKINF